MFRRIGGGVLGCGGGGRGGVRRWNRGDGGGAAMGSQAVVPKSGGGIKSDQWGRLGIGALGIGGGAAGLRMRVGEATSDDGEEEDEGGVRSASWGAS